MYECHEFEFALLLRWALFDGFERESLNCTHIISLR